MADYINNVATQDQYVEATTIGGPDFQADTLTVTVANAGVLMQLAVGVPGNWRWIDEREFLVPPQSFTIERVIGARFRSAVTATPAQILAALTGPADPAFGAGLPFTGTISASGGVSSNVIIPTVALASFPPATPVDGQTVLLVLPSTYDPIGGKAIRWLCTYDASAAMWQAAGPPLYAEVQTQELDSNAAYGDLATIGPTIAIPRPGDYIIASGNDVQQNAGNIGFMAYGGAGIGAAADADSAIGLDTAIAASPSHSREREKIGLTAATLTAKYRFGNNSVFHQKRWMRATPVRIS